MRLFIYLTPLAFYLVTPSPFPLSRGRGTEHIREAKSLSNSPTVSPSLEGERESYYKEGCHPS